MKHVILGNGAAGVTAAARIRKLRPEDQIVMVSAEDCPAYAKPMLPSYLAGKLALEKLYIRSFDWYRENQIELICADKAAAIHPGRREAVLQSGRVLSYDRLLLAFGGKAFVPMAPGQEMADTRVLNALEDAQLMLSMLEGRKRALVIGGGPTGIEVAFALAHRGISVELVEMMPMLLPAQMDDASFQALLVHFRNVGIEVLSGSKVAEFADGHTARIQTPQGERTISFDLLLSAVGTRPDIEWLAGSGLSTGRGVIVDDGLRTCFPDIFAAGDCAQLAEGSAGGYVPSYSWQNGMAQGRVAAENMAGLYTTLQGAQKAGTLMRFQDFPYASMGLIRPAEGDTHCKTEVDCQAERGIYSRLVYRDSDLAGFLLIGEAAARQTELSKKIGHSK